MIDFYSRVPKKYRENLEYRIKLRRDARRDRGLREAIRVACKNDFLYFLNAWAWLHETRVRFDDRGQQLPHIIPFITRSHQDEYFKTIRANLGVKNIGVLKCRDEGFSWGGIWLAMQDWTFNEDVKVGIVSSTEKKSDDAGNMDSLFAKVDFSIKRLPQWMRGVEGVDWDRHRNNHTLINHRQSTSINAFAASPDTGRGGRYLWFLLDEFGSREWQDEGKDKAVLEALFEATDSKLILSTPEGAAGEFYRVMTEASDMVRIQMNWRDNPVKAKGLYKMSGGQPTAVDPMNNPLHPDYDPPTPFILDRLSRLRKKGFDLDDATRSPWYDERCDQPESTLEGVAKNLDAKWGGSVQTPFDDYFFEIVNQTVNPPMLRGNFNVQDDGRWDFGKHKDGDLLLWCKLDNQNRPADRPYIVCADFAHGRGGAQSAESAAHVIDCVAREQVAEYVSKTRPPNEFTAICLGLCKMFNNAYFAWEHNNPGNVCTDIVVASSDVDYYCREKKDVATGRTTKTPGFWTDDRTKEILFSDFIFAVKDPTAGLVIRSQKLVDECSQYIRDKRGRIEHAATGPGHGDRVIAIAVGVQAMKDRPMGGTRQNEDEFDVDGAEPPRGTMAWRDWKFRQEMEENDNAAYSWDERSTADLTRGKALAW